MNYKSYFKRFGSITPFPGEHHFVSCYLQPLIARNSSTLHIEPIPEYVNPDGMKRTITGDLVFKGKGVKKKGLIIEVKCYNTSSESAKFTVAQVKKWSKSKKTIFIFVAFRPSKKPFLWIFKFTDAKFKNISQKKSGYFQVKLASILKGQDKVKNFSLNQKLSPEKWILSQLNRGRR